jgi:DNA-binding GntR family transcriptional regulator
VTASARTVTHGVGPRLVDLAYARIRELLLDDNLPEVFSEQGLAEQLGFSKTPVREALHRLSQEGLLRLIPRRGYLVPRLTAVDVRDIFETREALEGMAARLAARRMRDPERATLRAALDAVSLAPDAEADRTNLERMERGNSMLHELVLGAAANSRLEQALAPLRGQMQRVHLVAVRAPGRIRRSHLEHLEVLASLESRDPDAAEQAMRAHIRSTCQDVLEQVR